MTTPNINLTELANGQANYLSANDSFARIDALLQTPVISRTLTAAPGSPANGALYIMGSAWAGIAGSATGRLALWRTGAGWIVITPKEGWRFEVAADEVIYRYDGAAWQSTDATGFTGGTLASALNEAPAVTLASASTVDIGAAAANTVNITGTTSITGFDSIAAGAVRRLVFSASLVLTYNATSMILPTEGNIATAAGDSAEMLSLGGGNWRCIDYQRFSGAALSDGGGVTNPMTATADLIVGGASGVPERLAKGAALQVLRMNSAGDAQEYADPSGGGGAAWGGITGTLSDQTDLVSALGGKEMSLTAGANIAIDRTDPANPVISASASSGMTNPMTAAADMIVGGASGAPARLAKGAALQVLRMNAAGDAQEYADPAGGGGLTRFTEGYTNSGINNLRPVSSFVVNSSDSLGDIAIVPKGNGASFSLAIPDGASLGGDKRGAYAVDLQLERRFSSDAATGGNSFIGGGRRNTASGSFSAVISGESNTASGGYAVVVSGASNNASGAYSVVSGGSLNSSSGSGSFVGGGGGNQASGLNSAIIGGSDATTRGVRGAEAFASGSFFAVGGAQRGRYVMFRQTSDETPARLTCGGGSFVATDTQPTMPNSSAYAFTGRLVARDTSTSECAAWSIAGLIRRSSGAGSTALVGTPTVDSIAADSGLTSISVACTADTAIGCLAVDVTGASGKYMKWVLDLETVEVV